MIVAEQTVVPADPDLGASIEMKGTHGVVRDAAGCGEILDHAILEAVEAFTGCNPNVSLAILANRANDVKGQAFVAGVVGKFSILVMAHTFGGADPKRAVFAREEGAYLTADQTIGLG